MSVKCRKGSDTGGMIVKGRQQLGKVLKIYRKGEMKRGEKEVEKERRQEGEYEGKEKSE